MSRHVSKLIYQKTTPFSLSKKYSVQCLVYGFVSIFWGIVWRFQYFRYVSNWEIVVCWIAGTLETMKETDCLREKQFGGGINYFLREKWTQGIFPWRKSSTQCYCFPLCHGQCIEPPFTNLYQRSTIFTSTSGFLFFGKKLIEVIAYTLVLLNHSTSILLQLSLGLYFL